MAPSFVHCPGCDRHVRVADRVCPFCATAMPQLAEEPRRAAVPRGLTRAAILFAGAAAVTACGPGMTTEDAASDAMQNPDLMAAAYGPAPVDMGTSSDATDVATSPDIVALYGPAPVDSSTADARDATPDNMMVAAYGPAPVDP